MVDLFLISPSYVNYGKTRMSVWNFYSLLEVMPPLGISYVAANAINAGYNVKFIDMEAETTKFKDLKKIIKRIKPKLVGIGCTSPLFNNVIELSGIIKAAIDAPIIVGGPHALVDCDSIMSVKSIDYCLRGESDFTIVSLMDYLLKGKGSIQDINGVSYKEGGRVFHNKPVGAIADLDKIPFPNRQLLKHNLYYHPFIRGKSCSAIIATRGCPFNCIFCLQMSNKARRRSIGNVISEIRESLDRHKIRDFEFFDETFNLDPQWVIGFCRELVNQDIKIRWRARCRPEFFTKEVVQSMKRAGCYMISIGVESANNRTLEWLNKKYTIEQVKKAAEIISAEKIGLHGYFILGSPVETKEDMLRTIDFACTSKIDFATFSILTPLPGTEFFNIALKEGYIESYDRNDYSNTIGVCKTLIKHPTMTKKEVQSLYKYAYRRFYLRKRLIIRSFKEAAFNTGIYCKIMKRIFKIFLF